MGKKAVNIVFIVLIVLGVLGFVFEKQVVAFFDKTTAFVLTDIQLESMIGQETKITPGFRGYVVFYSDVKGCTSCLGRLSYLGELQQAYDDVGFFAVLRGLDRRESFLDLMTEYNVAGEYLVDRRENIGKQLTLSDHPMLLFFNRGGSIVASIPMDVEHDGLKRQLFRYVEEL